MKAFTFTYALLLIVLGLGGYLLTGAQSVTALIPAFFGVIVLALAWIVHANPNATKVVMHVVMVLALLAFLGSVNGFADVLSLLQGADVERSAAAVSKSIMALLSLIYLILGIKSFVDARRSQS